MKQKQTIVAWQHLTTHTQLEEEALVTYHLIQSQIQCMDNISWCNHEIMQQ